VCVKDVTVCVKDVTMGVTDVTVGVTDVTVGVTDVTMCAERKLNAIVTQGKEAATPKKVWRIHRADHWDNLLQYRTHTTWLECIRCVNSAHFFWILAQK
jgi:hypothetical protein